MCESRKNTSPYPFGSITEFKIIWWGHHVCESRKTGDGSDSEDDHDDDDHDDNNNDDNDDEDSA